MSEKLREEAVPNTNSHDAEQLDGTDCLEKTGFDWDALEKKGFRLRCKSNRRKMVSEGQRIKCSGLLILALLCCTVCLPSGA